MKNEQTNSKIRFLQIPKTAGSSFNECLTVQYLPAFIRGQRFTFSGNFAADRQRYLQLSPSKRKKTVLYTGHSPLLTGIEEIDCLPTITFLRNPIERVISYCQHVSEDKSIREQRGVSHNNMDLSAFLSSGRTQLSNFQSKLLLGRESYTIPNAGIEEIVNRALKVLEHRLICFGITEDFDRSLLLFKHTLGWHKSPVYRRRNTKNIKALIDVTPEHIKKIAELNKIDLLVYERACALFTRRIEVLGDKLDRDLSDFRRGLKGKKLIFTAIDLARFLRKLSFH